MRLMAVHAHPDDESSKGAATTAKYVAEGVDVMVATCTGGERGSVLNPKLVGDPEVELNIAAILCWLGDYLAGAERRTLQSCPEAMQLAAAWQAALLSPLSQSAQRPQPAQTPRPIRRAPAVENPRWQSILAVLATV